MRCEKFDEWINLFLDGRLDPDKEEKLREHLSRCKRCQKKLSFLRSVETTARKVQIKEPSPQYWESFSARVREKIIAREERTQLVGLKKTLENIFSFSPLKIKVAAGVISVVLVFAIGKLYLDYRGKEILPSRTTTQEVREPGLKIQKIEKKKEEPKEKEWVPVEPKLKEPKTAGSVGLEEQTPEKGKANIKDRGAIEKMMKEEKEKISSPEKLSESATLTHKPEVGGAGVRETAKVKVVEKKVTPEQERQKAEESMIQKKISAVQPTLRTSPTMDHYVVNKEIVPKIEEKDTSMRVNDLRRIIKVWKAYIKENPTDSLTQQGYLQVAVGYYLLSKLSQDSTVISQGLKLLKSYIKQVKDPAIKYDLTIRLRKIQEIKTTGKK